MATRHRMPPSDAFTSLHLAEHLPTSCQKLRNRQHDLLVIKDSIVKTLPCAFLPRNNTRLASFRAPIKMPSLKTFAFLFTVALCLVAPGVTGRSSSSGSRGGRWRGSSSDSSFWFWAYTFSDSNWPKTPMSMQDFGRTNVDIMWQNRPANATAATCIQSPWFVKNWDKVSPSIRVSYFKKGFYPFTSNKVRK